MLVRASRSRLPPVSHQAPQQSYNQLYLPWLCPSIYALKPPSRRTATSSRNGAANISSPPTTGTSRWPVSSAPQARRGLASAAPAENIPSHDDFVPFEAPPSLFGEPPTTQSPFRTVVPRPHIPGVFDAKDSILVDDSITTAPPAFKSFNAISGEIAEIHQTLHACLQVGRLARAVALMHRLSTLYKPDAPGLLAAHNDYLRELTYRLSRSKDQQLLEDIQNWFEVNMRGKRVNPDATTYALMIQAAFQELGAEKVSHTIKRYALLAEEAGVVDETVAIASSVLDDECLDMLREILPEQCAQLENILPDIPSPVIIGPEITRPQKAYGLPEVRPVDVKGLGLEALRRSLSIFSNTDAESLMHDHQIPQAEQDNERNIARQRILERDTYVSALDRWREENMHHQKLGINSSLKNPSIGSLMWDWHELLVPLIQEEVKKANQSEAKPIKSTTDKDRCAYGPFLQYLSPEKLSAVLILHLMTVLSTAAQLDTGARLGQIVMKVGDAIQDESVAETIRLNQARVKAGQKKPDRLAKLRAFIKRRNPRSSYAKLLGADQTLSQITETLQWSKPIKAKVAAILLFHLISVAKVDVVSVHPVTHEVVKERQPVFFHTYQYTQGKRVGLVRFNKAMVSKLAKEPVKSLLSKHLPMVVKPRPWTNFRDGGFLEHSVPVVRIRAMDLSRQYAITASANGDMAHLFAGLDVLGKTPWQVNRPVFEAMVEAWNTGQEFAKIPPEEPRADLPPEPAPSDDFGPRYKWLKQVKAIQDIRSGQRSNRCFQNFQLEVARAYMHETFYFPHNVDFRGRAYPISPFFNYMGADNVRGLLLFAQGKKLGPGGLSWLKIHLANLYGYDKASFTERQDFTMEHIADIYDSANNPLKGKRWWLKAEDPWQCLSACIELKNALESPDPHEFISHLPIHQDGTCNGLQHYAALGGDAIGAKQVNLEPGDRPSDIYTAVAELVKAEVTDDAARGEELARMLQGKVTRKVVKQTVMTNVYGVTFLGAKRQVRRQLDEILAATPDSNSEKVDRASLYIAKKIFKALSSMFNGAHDIQYWLGDCASRISLSLSPEQIDSTVGNAASTTDAQFQRPPSVGKAPDGPTAFRTPVIWTNPLRMPVVQPYRATSARRVPTNLQSINLHCPTASDPVSKRKQLQAFPPNFIHSLDASHMILTALKCDEKGLTFASVHDSFWTHAGDVDTMNGIIRDSFVRMHSEDIIGRLAAEFATRYKGSMYLATIKKASPLGRKIHSWRLRVPLQQRLTGNNLKIEELRLEKSRQDLLASRDVHDRKKGAAMVTPAQLFESTADETDLVPENNLEGTGIGEMPSARITKLQANEQLDVGDLDNVKLLESRLDEPDSEDDLDSTESPSDEGPVTAEKISDDGSAQSTLTKRPKRSFTRYSERPNLDSAWLGSKEIMSVEELTTVSPASNRPILTRNGLADSDVVLLPAVATQAFNSYRNLPLEQRQAIVEKGLKLLAEKKDVLARELTEQMGRPISYAAKEITTAVARGEYLLRISGNALKDTDGESEKGFKRFIRKMPLGPILILFAWNYPYLILINSLIPALLAGNSVILKPSPQTPTIVEHIRNIFLQAGLPENVIQYFHCGSLTRLEQIIRSPQVRLVCFTGSVSGGLQVQRAAADRVVPVGLELGGKDPAYVRADVDVKWAAEEIVDGAIFNSGQSCCSIERVYVADTIHDEFVTALQEVLKGYKLGDPLDPATNVGPVVSKKAVRTIREHVDDALSKGAIDATPENESFASPPPDGNYVKPTLLTNVSHEMDVMNEETFGPIIPLMKVGSDEEAIRLMNDSEFGLTASIWTKDTVKGGELAEEVEAGTVFVNRCDYPSPDLAWTGWKDSGKGVTLSKFGFEQFVRLKSYHVKDYPAS